MRCPQCDMELKADAIYCSRCGRLVVRPETPPPDVATEPAIDIQATQEVPPISPDMPLDSIAAAETREWSLGAGSRPSETTAPPLAVDSVIGEHYRVARVLLTRVDGIIYEVADVRQDVQCWSCDAPIAEDSDQFCKTCGAELHSGVLYLREEQLAPAALSDALTLAPNSLIHGDRLFTTVEYDPAWDEESADAPEPWLNSLSAFPAATTGASEASPESLQHDLQAAIFEQNNAPTIEATLYDDTQPALPDPLLFRLGVASDVGRTRRGRMNEDTALVAQLAHAGENAPAPLTLCVVADGLGGHDDGQRAGRLAARIIAGHVTQSYWLHALNGVYPPPTDSATLGLALREAILAANEHILQLNRQEGGDMGCTVTAFLAQGTAMCVANVGDSRTYVFDGAQVQRLTTDHSLVARLVLAGMLAPDDVYSHPQRSQIYRSLGDEGELVVDLFPREARPGETYILCSDGLWEMIRDPAIAALLRELGGAPAQQVAEHLIQLANANGGEDNVSVIVAQVAP